MHHQIPVVVFLQLLTELHLSPFEYRRKGTNDPIRTIKGRLSFRRDVAGRERVVSRKRNSRSFQALSYQD